MFPVDFIVMALVLGIPFMKTARIIVDVDKWELQLRAQNEETTFNLFGGLKNLNSGEECVEKDGLKRDFHLEINRRQARWR